MDKQLTALLEKAASGEIKTIVTSDVERMGDSPDEVKSILAKLKACGVEVVDTSKGSGKTAKYERAR